jgi:hypothetical protein
LIEKRLLHVILEAIVENLARYPGLANCPATIQAFSLIVAVKRKAADVVNHLLDKKPENSTVCGEELLKKAKDLALRFNNGELPDYTRGMHEALDSVNESLASNYAGYDSKIWAEADDFGLSFTGSLEALRREFRSALAMADGSVLLWAVQQRLADIVTILLKARQAAAPPDTTYKKWLCPFRAAWFGNNPVIKLLLEEGMHPNHSGGPPAYIRQELARDEPYWMGANHVWARHQGDEDEDIEDDRSCPILYLAVFNGHLDTIRLLLDAKADPNAYCYRSTALMIAIQKQRADIVFCLLNAGAHVNAVPKGAHTSALNEAIIWGNDTIIESLLKLGASLDHEVYGKRTVVSEKSVGRESMRSYVRARINAMRGNRPSSPGLMDMAWEISES